jgi:hypothetical protein
MSSVRHLLFIPLILSCLEGMAQSGQRTDTTRFSLRYNTGYDSAYVWDYTHMITGRVYASTKTNAFSLLDRETGERLRYRPNNQVNLGIGASYRSYTLNLGVGFGFLNKDADDKGETDYLDAQFNYFSRFIAINGFFQVYEGYYVDGRTPQELNWTSPVTKAYREDVRQENLGLSAVYIVNNERFSYRAAFNQDAWQRRSAGSFLAGAYISYYKVYARSDSSLMPSVLADLFDPVMSFANANFYDLGLMGGYAHTFVVRQHWFLTLSGALGLGGSLYETWPDPTEASATRGRFNPGYRAQLRSAAGYNGTRTCVALTFNAEGNMYSLGEAEAFQWTVGNLRFNVAHRFNTRVTPMDRAIKGVLGE